MGLSDVTRKNCPLILKKTARCSLKLRKSFKKIMLQEKIKRELDFYQKGDLIKMNKNTELLNNDDQPFTGNAVTKENGDSFIYI